MRKLKSLNWHAINLIKGGFENKETVKVSLFLY